MATDGIKQLRNTMLETEQLGFDTLKKQQYQLGQSIHDLLEAYGYPRVAAEGFRAPGVVVCYTEDDAMKDATLFRKIGYQTASGIALKVGERDDYKTFRIGLFGLDKLNYISETVDSFRQALQQIKEKA
jgi:aspartate aminotransferase-like enzyme